jgi:16S rRNA (adenine1518-N6/adenine1519-N6)-dimethyltransferase
MRAKKSLGQNFLNAPQVVAKMIDALGITRDDLVVEVGPGKGALTKALLERGTRVHAYELDQRMVEYLNEHLADYIESKQLQIVQGDILEADVCADLQGKNYRVVANIPYYITNAIIRYFLESDHQPTSMSLLVQKEVAERIARDEHESILSLSVKAYGEPRFLTKVPARYFSPQPKVDSAVITISGISRENFSDEIHEERFFTVIKTAFAHKRKQLASNLAGLWFNKERWQELLQERGYQTTARAEVLKLADWLYFSNKAEES